VTAPTRRVRPEFSGELQAFMTLFSRLSMNDIAISSRMVQAQFVIDDAAPLVGISANTLRQRVFALCKKLETNFSTLNFGRGAVGREVSYDGTDGMGDSLGV